MVVDIKPGRGEEQVVSAPVVITFDQPMDVTSTARAFSIEPKVNGDLKIQGNQLVFAPSKNLERASDYRIRLTADATSKAGLKLPSPLSYDFRTTGFLEVTNTQPSNGATEVAVDSKITVAFNRPVVPLEGSGSASNMANSLVISPTVVGTGEWLNTAIYQFTPTKGLAASTTYTATVKAGLEDTTGGTLPEDYSFSFRTVDPTVLSWLPENSLKVKIEVPITVTFSMPMDRPSTEAAFSIVDGTGERVPGFFTWTQNDAVLGFKPAKSLQFGATYRAAVATTAKPANGQGSLRDTSNAVFNFRTVSLPKVTLTDPREGSSRANPTGGVILNFASPMDPASFVTGTVSVIPKPARIVTSYNEWENNLFVSFEKLPSTPYTVTLSGKVADPYGNTLGRDFLLHFTTRDYDPILYLNTPGLVGTYNAYTQTEAAVTYRNVGAVDFHLYRVEPEDLLKLTTKNYWDAWNKYRPSQQNLLREWTVKTTAKRNEVAVLHSPLATQEGQSLAPGMYFLEVTSPGVTSQDPNANRQLIIRTPLNVTLKSAAKEALAWVTDLKSGQPVQGVSVRFTDNGKIDVTATTDSNGIGRVEFPQSRQTWEPLIAIATGPADSFGVASNNWRDGISPWDFGVPGGISTEAYAGYVYTDRPIYRPGQTVYWKALIRQDDDARYHIPPPGQPVTVTIRDDQGNELLNQRMTLSPMGSVNGKLALSPDAGLGYYYISVQLTEQNNYGTGFQVAEYRKPEYELSAETDKPEYTQGEQINVAVQASYFFGGPVKGGKVSWALVSNDYLFEYQGQNGGYYSFSDWDWYEPRREPYAGVLSQGSGVTDAQGRFAFSVPADITRFPLSQRFTFDITVTDVNNQAVSTQASAIVHKGEFYIGLRPEGYVSLVGQPNRVDVITVDPKSQPAPNQTVNLVVNQIEWYSVQQQAEDGRFYWTTKAKKTPTYTETLTTDAAGTAVLTWTPKTGGEYKVDATARDRSGHTIRSAAYVWVSGSDYVSWRQENNDRIELVADRDEYVPGDLAELLVASPYQGTVKALVTVERNHILSHQVIDLKGNSQVLKLPIVADHAPNIYVSVVLVKGMDESSPAPSFKMGLKQLKVSVADKQLQVILTPDRNKVGPRERIRWTVQTLDSAGKPVQAEVSLALVDKAIYSLASDNAGTLMDRFYSQRSPGVDTALTLVVNVDRIVAQLPEGGKGGGGGGGMAGALTVRQAFPDVAYWNAVVTTGTDGKAQVELTLPDNLTTWTMDARAITDATLVGQAKADIVATKELLVRPVLPRFFIEGDRAEVAAVIHNNTDHALDVTYGLKATGLDVPDKTEDKVAISAGSTYKAAWAVSVQPEVNEVRVLMSATAEDLNDAVEVSLPVYRYTTPEVTGTSGQVGLDDPRLELIRVPEGVDPTRGELDVTMEPSLAAGMRGALTYLEHYPYECVEQTISRFLPNVVSYAALKSLGVERPELHATLTQQVAIGLQRIYSQQHVDGGWGWWQKDLSSPGISAYVVFGLAEAKQAGFTVDQTILDRGIAFVKRNLKAPQNLNPWELNEQAFMVYALAEAGDMQPNRAGALYEQREKLSLYAEAYLAMALQLINDDASAARIENLLADLNSHAVVSATSAHWEEDWTDYWNMNTNTRTTSIVLDALVRLDPKNALGPNAVRWLMSARQADSWETTQENAWAIMALTDWMLASGELEGDYDWQVTLNGQLMGQGTVTPQTVGETVTLRADISQLLLDQTNALLLQRTATGTQTGKGQLYYTAYLKTYLPVEEIEPASKGLTISREYRLADCGLPQQEGPAGNQDGGEAAQCPLTTQARVGDVLDVTINIVVPHALQFVVVEDPLPAGTEAIDTSLRTTSITAQGPSITPKGETPANAWSWWWTPTHTDLRDEKVALFATELSPGSYQFKYQIRASLPGRYLTLPPTGYQMYFPETWGRGAGSVFTVTQ